MRRVPLDVTLPTIGNIFLGMNDDVYMVSTETPGPDGLVSRVYMRPGRGHGPGGAGAAADTGSARGETDAPICYCQPF